MEKNALSRATTTFGLGGLAVVAVAACATVSPQDLENELAQLRQEMSETDERVERLEGRVDEVEQRLERRMAAVEQNLSAMEDEFGGVVERMEQAIRFNAPIYFEFDDATVREQYRPILERFAQVVEHYYPEALITIEGFTDPSGPRAYNLRLGEQRANAVRDFLVDAGLNEGQLRTVSYGPDNARQVAPGERGPGEQGWQNRRVAFVVDHDGAMPDTPRQPVASN
jgi:peptidoglycan-associated lipoprotein